MSNRQKGYTVVIGDLVKSRELKDRPKAARVIRNTLRKTNAQFSEFIYAPLQLTKGIDEFSLVLKKPEACYRICRFINGEIFPESFRFSIASGVLDIGISTKDSRKMDGPAFHLAAKNLDSIKDTNRYYIFSVDNKVDPWLNEIANLNSIISRKFHPLQHEVFKLYQRYNRQREVAAKLKITQQAVSFSLNSIDYKQLISSFKLVDSCLRELK